MHASAHTHTRARAPTHTHTSQFKLSTYQLLINYYINFIYLFMCVYHLPHLFIPTVGAQGRGMCYPVCGMVHIKDILLLSKRVAHVVASCRGYLSVPLYIRK